MFQLSVALQRAQVSFTTLTTLSLILATASNLPNYDYYVRVTQSYALLLLNADILRQKLVVQLGTCFLPCFGLS